MECPDWTILKFKQDKGLCKGFPFIDMENLSEHILKPSSVAEKLLEVNRRTQWGLGEQDQGHQETPWKKGIRFSANCLLEHGGVHQAQG